MMAGNQSLLDSLSHLAYCADIQTPLLINICVGLPANMYVMCLILSAPGDKAAELFFLNQVVCEVVICVNSVIWLIVLNTSALSASFLLYSRKFGWGFLLSGRSIFMGVLCLERYLAVVHPVTFLKYKPLRYRLAGSAVCWLSVGVMTGMYMSIPYPHVQYVFYGLGSACFLAEYFLCVRVLRALLRPGPGEENQSSNGLSSVKLKAFRIIAVVCVTSTLTFVPYSLGIALLAHVSQKVSSTLFCTAFYAAMFTGYISPLLYIYRAGRLQNCIQKILDKCHV